MAVKSFIADNIQREINKKHSKLGNLKMLHPKHSKVDTWRNCQCRICKERLDVLTHAHAAKHGYGCKEDMIADGKVQWL